MHGPALEDTLIQSLFSHRGLFFGDYIPPSADPRIYDEVTDFKELTSIMEK